MAPLDPESGDDTGRTTPDAAPHNQLAEQLNAVAALLGDLADVYEAIEDTHSDITETLWSTNNSREF